MVASAAVTSIASTVVAVVDFTPAVPANAVLAPSPAAAGAVAAAVVKDEFGTQDATSAERGEEIEECLAPSVLPM